jgi:hypothetical protein
LRSSAQFSESIIVVVNLGVVQKLHAIGKWHISAHCYQLVIVDHDERAQARIASGSQATNSHADRKLSSLFDSELSSAVFTASAHVMMVGSKAKKLVPILHKWYRARDVCVMVSPNRHSHIVAMYGKYRNITPHLLPNIDLPDESTRT